MLKLVAIGTWLILVTAGATFGSVYLGRSGGGTSSAPDDQGIENLTSEMMSVPIMRGDDVAGYVVLQLAFAADRTILEHKKLDPMPFLMDAAFRVIFTNTELDFRRLKSGDLEKLTTAIGKEANSRLGQDLVRQVLLQQLNYVKKEDIRTNWISSGGAQN